METLIAQFWNGINEAITQAFALLVVSYILVSIMSIWLLIKVVLPNDISEKKMKIFSFLMTVVIGIAFCILGKYEPEKIIVSGLTVNTFYEFIVKWVLTKLGIQYQTGDPELLKPKRKDED